MECLSFSVTTRGAVEGAFPSDFLDPCTKNFISTVETKTADNSFFTRGKIYEMLSCEQFSDEFNGLPEQAGSGPRAFCGAVATAAAIRVAAAIEAAPADATLPSIIAQALRQIRDNFASDVVYGLNSVREDRLAVDEEFPTFSPTMEAKESFLKNWIANYEVSDLAGKLQQVSQQQKKDDDEETDKTLHPFEQAAAAVPTLWRRLAFLRANQFPELQTATPDERLRLLREEASFGGVPLPKKVDPTKDTWLHGDASCFLELFPSPGPQKQRFLRLFPSASKCACGGEAQEEEESNDEKVIEKKKLRDAALNRTEGETVTSTVASVVPCFSSESGSSRLPPLPFVAIADLKGHFVAMVFFRENAEGEEGDKSKSCISMALINSIQHSYLTTSPAPSGYFDLVCAMFAAESLNAKVQE